MNQFKDVFLGFDKRPYSRATTSQKCVRAGGKHNDLENVGYTRATTPSSRCWATSASATTSSATPSVRLGTADRGLQAAQGKADRHGVCRDDEAYDIWTKEVGVPARRPHRRQQGRPLRLRQLLDDGRHRPCGPCTEIFYDHGEHLGRPPGSPEEDGDRFIEIWNNVFMQFNRDEGRRDASAAQAVGRHRHGPGAHLRRAAGRACQLRDRPVPGLIKAAAARPATPT